LGPLEPNWFEVLTAQASLNEGDVADNDELCANQEGHFKAPLEKTAAESQLFSTPKVFRHSRIVSPDTEDGPLFTAAQEKETLPWMPTQSPCLFQPPKQCVSNLKCEGVQPQNEESFDLLDSPEKSSASYANHISESLGAQINPDISWTSSFNTPPALPSTLILCELLKQLATKTDESPCPVSVTADRKVVFVRKLFPSLSNSSLKTSRTSLGPVFPVTDTCFESPLNQSENHQQQKVPDALEGDVYSAEAPKTFFANSSSALRKVKPDRVKRKQIIQTNVDVCSHENTSNSDNAASSEEAIADLESGGLPSTPLVKTGDTAVSQWSPLSLSEISSSAVGSNMTLLGDTDSVQPTRPTLKMTDSGFTQKKRKFVYTITTTKSPACGQDFQTTDPSLKISESEQQNSKSFMNTPDKEACQRTKNQRIIVEETIDSSLGTKLQDIDMSQLCRDFAQDFSQMTDLKPVENMQRNFSPAVCLSALKQAKQNRKPANFPNDYSCISKNRLIPTSNQPCSISEVTMIDSGFQSGVADVSHMTSSSFGLPLLENVGQNQPKLSFKTGMHNFPSTNGSGKPKFDVEVPVQRSGTGQALDHEKEIELHIASISTDQLWDREEAVGESKSSQPQKTPVFLLPADASGFRTSSNKDIPISLANLEKAKCFFEVTEDKKSSLDNCTKSYHGIIYKSNSICEKATDTSSNSSLPACAGKSFGNVSSQLTASEKADVSELCTLLEEADSQFEFTQFKSTKKLPEHQHNHSLPQKEDKDLDPALLADLDFDDSFSSEGGKHSLVMMNNKVASVLENRTHGETAKAINQCTGVSDLLERETPLNSLSGNISEEREFLKFDKPNILPGAEDTEARYLEKNKGVIHSEAFRTAGGNVLHVSKKCLNKAKALFADLESNLTDQKPSDKQNGKNAAITEQKCNRDSDTSRKDSERKKENWDVGSKIENCFSKLEGVVCSNKNVRNKSDTKSVKNNEIDTIICENGFRKASGKGISISANYMQEADAFFKDCHVMEHKESNKSFSNYKSPQVSISKKSVTGCTKLENVNTAVVSHHTKGRRLNEVERNGKFTAALKNEDEKSFPTSKPFAMLHPSKSTDSSAFEELCTGDGFCTAAGKNISVSAVAMKKDESLLNHIHAPEEINKETNEKEKALKTKCLGDKISNLDAGGFQVVNGKKCAISSTPLKKATLLKESEKSQDEICISSHQSSSKIPVIPVTNLWSCGFSTASGKPVVLSSVALEKTQTLFSDISLNMDKVAESAPVKQDKKHQTEPEKICSGFTTAGGANDQMSQEKFYDLVLAKAVEDEDALSTNGVLESNNVMLGSVGSKKEDEKPHADQRFRTHTPVEAVKGCFKDADKQEKHKENLVPQASCGFKTASGKKVEISFEALKKAENLLGDCVGVMDTVNAALPESKAIDLPVRNDGFQSASGKPVALSSEALQKAKSLFSDIGFRAEDSDTSQMRSNNQDGSNNTEKMSCGFTTARGEKVDVLQKNLQKAKVLFKELDDQVLTKAAQEENAFFAGCDMDINKEMLENDLKGKVHMQRSRKASVAKCYTDDEMRVSISIPQCSSNANKQMEQRENILPQASCGFQTATEALSRSKRLLSENKADEESPCVFAASGKPFSHEALQKAKTFFRSGVKSLPSAADSRSDDHVDEKSHLSICNLNTKSSNQRSDLIQTNKSSDPKFQLLNLAGCTETQHKFLAQEALDCTKALLEDEVLAGQSLLTTSENLQLLDDQDLNKKSAEEDKGRKRRSAEDLTAQPPSKRRLLEEFDRTAENSRGSGLHPVKSGPNGLMDRGVFRYGAFLHPNITKPNRDTKSFVDTRVQRTIQMPHSDQGDCRSAACRMPTFVPPFFKNAKRDPLNKPEARDRKKVPAFVPPFKKQRVVQQESSPKQQEDNKQHHSLCLGTNSKTDAPLTKTTQSCEEVVTLVNSSNTKTINQNVPLKVGSVSSTEMLHVDDKLSESQDRTENIGLARDMQDMRIRKKKRQTIRPLPGSLFLTKTSGVARIPLKAALYECGVHKYVPEITGANAESFRFNLLQFVKQETLADGGGVQLADGGWLIPSDDWTAGKEEFYRALCDTSGVDPKLISEQWVYNHYRWIVWKQASMEKSFPETMGSLCLTPEQVLLQLKYRYDVEVDHSRRPALRKIMERDDTPAKTLVLCVCEIISKGHLLHAQSCSDTKMSQSAETKVETPVAVVWLTDGWYAIKAQLDEPLTAMLHKGRLAVGGKLIIHGAQLIGPQDGCSPLEAPDSLMLKICANSTRRARWDAKLGFHTDPRPFLLPVSCLYSNGGPVGCVDIFILRNYPIQWMERKSDGGVVFRSVRAEEKEARRFNCHKQKAVELLFAKVQAEFEKEEEGSIKCQRRRQTVGKQDIGNLQEGEDLYEALGDDPAYLEAHLSEQQLESLQAYRRSLMEKKQAELQDRYWRALDAEDNEMSCPKRDVTPVWRLCIADSRIQSSCVYQLNLWRPSSDLQSLLKEGRRFKVYNLVASDGKKRSSVETVQLTGTKKTQFQELQVSQEWVSSHFRQRISTDFVDLQNEEFKPLCGEVDLTGLVISVVDQQGSSPAFYLVDGKKNFVKVRCFSSLTQAGLEDIVKPRVLLALSNLQLRGQSIHPTPVLYAGDLTAFSTNPKEIHLQESLNQLKNVVQGQDNFFLTAEEKLAHLIKSDGSCSSSLQPQTPVAARRQDSKTNMAFLKPIKSLGSFTPVSSNLPVATSSTEKDPKSLKRKRALDYLSRIPSPPPISPLGSVVSPCVNKTFNPPRRSGAPSTLKPVQTATPKPADSLVDDEWVNDEELVMIDTQAL
ncbi:hypothetical protein CCH79_00012146, partial [Gambusia affinis]